MAGLERVLMMNEWLTGIPSDEMATAVARGKREGKVRPCSEERPAGKTACQACQLCRTAPPPAPKPRATNAFTDMVHGPLTSPPGVSQLVSLLFACKSHADTMHTTSWHFLFSTRPDIYFHTVARSCNRFNPPKNNSEN